MGVNEQRIFDALMDRMKSCPMEKTEAVEFVKAAKAALDELKDAEPKPFGD